MYSFFCLFTLILLCSNKEKHNDFSLSLSSFLFYFFAFWKRSCSVSFVNSVNSHPQGIVYQFGLGEGGGGGWGMGSFMLFWGRTVFEMWGFLFLFFFLSSVTMLWIRCMYSIYVTLADCWAQQIPVIRVESQALISARTEPSHLTDACWVFFFFSSFFLFLFPAVAETLLL